MNLAGVLILTGQFDEAECWLRRAARTLEAHAGPGIRLLLHMGTGMLLSGRGKLREALAEYNAAGRLQAQMESSHACAGQLTGWTLSTQAGLGQLTEARAALAALGPELAATTEIANARAAICLAEANPAAAFAAVQDVLNGITPPNSYATVVEANILAAIAHRELGDQCAATIATEGAVALAEADRLILPFAMTRDAAALGAPDQLDRSPSWSGYRRSSAPRRMGVRGSRVPCRCRCR